MNRLAATSHKIRIVVLPAIITASMAIIMCIAFAALIFSGSLSEYLPLALSVIVAGSVFVGILGSLFSRSRRMIFLPDDDTAPIYAAMVAATLLSLPASVAGSQMLVVSLVVILSTTLLSGLVLAFLGYIKAGAIVEFMPYSVMGGYFATAGWLLVLGGLRVVTGDSLDSLNHALQASQENSLALLFAVSIGLALFFLSKRIKSALLIPAVLIFAVIIFYGVMILQDVSIDTDVLQAWLIGPFSEDSTRLFNWHLFKIASVDWQLLLSSTTWMLTIVLLSVVSILLTVSGLSILAKEDIPINHELKVIGISNIVSSLFGGMAAQPSLTLTSMAADMGAPKTRWLGFLVAIFSALIFYFCVDLIGYIPRFVIAGLLLYIGFGFLHAWLFETRNKYELHEYLVIPIILLVAIFFGFVQGVLIGLLAAVILFVIKYSQINVIRFEGDGSGLRSNVERTPAERAELNDHADQIFVIGLQGYLFFGTAARIYSRLNEKLEEPNPSIRFVVLDFEQVTGIDASAGLNFEKLSQLMMLKKVHLLVAGIDKRFASSMEGAGFYAENTIYVSFLKDIDFALEWCEEKILQKVSSSNNDFQSFVCDLEAHSPPMYNSFLSYLQVLDIPEGYVLSKQGDESKELFLLESTSASAYINDENGSQLRVRRASSGTVYGEIGFFYGTPRTATIVTDEPGRVYVLTHGALSSMEKEQPEIAARFEKYLLSLSIERLFLTTQTLMTILK